jgi:putative hemolysin
MRNDGIKGTPVRIILFLTFIALALACGTVPVSAMINPAAGYCMALGYQYTDTTGPDGSMTGYCVLANNQSVDAWRFLRGEVARDQSYCVKQGYGIKLVNDSVTCKIFLTTSCAVCVMPDGSTTEITKLMKLDFREKICNDKICCDPRTDITCPIGSERTEGSKMTGISGIYLIGIALIVIIIIAGLAFFIIRKRKDVPAEKKEK